MAQTLQEKIDAIGTWHGKNGILVISKEAVNETLQELREETEKIFFGYISMIDRNAKFTPKDTQMYLEMCKDRVLALIGEGK